jgi:hypothetical protein
MKSATYTRHIKNSREIVGVSTVTFGSKNEPTPSIKEMWLMQRSSVVVVRRVVTGFASSDMR